MKAQIINNNTLESKGLQELLYECCPEITSMRDADCALQVQVILPLMQPDIVFIKVELQDENGFELFKNIPPEHRQFSAIFMSRDESHRERDTGGSTGGTVIMKNKKQLPVARQYKHLFRESRDESTKNGGRKI